MAAISSTASSLSSITENSTYGVEDEDLSRHEDNAETLENINEEHDGDARPRRNFGKSRSGRSLGRNSHSSSHVEAEERRGERSAQERRRKSRSSGSSRSSRHSSTKSERKRRKGTQPDAAQNISRSNSRKRLSSDHRRSNSTSDLQKTQQIITTGTSIMSTSHSLRRFSSDDQRSSSSPDSPQVENEANRMKVCRSKSSRRSPSHRRRSSSISSDLTNDVVDISKSKKKAKGKSNGRSLISTSSHRANGNDTDESSRETIVGGMIVEERRQHHQTASRPLSSTHPSEGSCQSDSVTNITKQPKSVDARGGHGHICESRSLESEQNASEVSEDDEGERPGAYRVSSYHTSRVMSFGSWPSDDISSAGHHSFAVSDNNDTATDSSHSFASSRETPSVSNSSTMVTAQVARDMTEEIEAAREQGRTEGWIQASNHGCSIVIAVEQPSRRPKANDDAWISPRKKWFIVLFGLCLCFIVISSIVGYFVLLRQEENEPIVETSMVPGEDGEDGSELEAMISFDPPTAEDCASIANGTDVAGQEDMFTQFVDMHIEITTTSEEDAAFLVGLLRQQIQLNLIPFLIGCNDLAGNVIGNGVVESVSNETSTCLFQNNPLCLEVVLTVKIYLRHKEDGSTVVEIMNDILLHEDLNESLELPPTVQTAGVALIVPSNFSTDVPTETPSWSPSGMHTYGTIGPPSAMPNTPRPSVEPTYSLTIPPVDTAAPSMEPTLMHHQAPKPTPESSPNPTSRPAQLDNETLLIPPSVPSSVPSLFPINKTPSGTPTESPSALLPSALPSAPPSVSPSLRPTTRVPSRRPTAVPITSLSPTNNPSVSPTTFSPSSAPTSRPPSTSPSDRPSELPTTSLRPSESPTPQPSVSGFYWATCGKLNFCNGRPNTVQNANHATIDGIPSTLDEDMLAVRCCSDTFLEGFEGPFAESCPYAESVIGSNGGFGGTCYNTATYWEAEHVCSSVGARLCTLEEIMNRCTERTGCGHNYRMIWTSTPGSP